MSKSFERLLRHTLDLPDNVKTTVTVDCANGYRWEGDLRELREALMIAEQRDPAKVYRYCPYCGEKL